MELEIKYNRNVRSCAMSKRPNQSGILLNDWAPDTIRLESINPVTKTATTYLYLEIPRENLDDVIEALKQFK